MGAIRAPDTDHGKKMDSGTSQTEDLSASVLSLKPRVVAVYVKSTLNTFYTYIYIYTRQYMFLHTHMQNNHKETQNNHRDAKELQRDATKTHK